MKDEFAQECVNSIKQMWRHRKGITLLGRKVIADNRIPGLILDTFDNLGFVTKDGRKPLIVNKKETSYGWHLVVHLPPGKSFQQCVKAKHFFECATNSFIVMTWNGALQMDIQTGSLPTMIPYTWADVPGELPMPIGYSRSGLETFDLCVSPHLLISGNTGNGKSMAIHCIVNSLLSKAMTCIGDPKIVDYRYLKPAILLARSDDEICRMLEMVNKEADRRLGLIDKADVSVTKIQELDNPPPLVVVVVEELGEISKEAMQLTNRLGRLGRAPGIHLIAATQYPYAEVIPSTTRNLFQARLCFAVASESSSRVILGEDGSMAAWLPPIPGRGIWKFGHEFKEVQTMYLSKKERTRIAEKLEPRQWNFESRKKLLPS